MRTPTSCARRWRDLPALIGGADAIALMPLRCRHGAHRACAPHRAQHAKHLMEEANLARVIDPAGGAFGIERSPKSSPSGVDQFQAIEAQGGMATRSPAGSPAGSRRAGKPSASACAPRRLDRRRFPIFHCCSLIDTSYQKTARRFNMLSEPFAAGPSSRRGIRSLARGKRCAFERPPASGLRFISSHRQ